jgi:hypothetical protein
MTQPETYFPRDPTGRVFGSHTLYLVHAERVRQDGLWGEQNHDPSTWNEILGEEVGEVDKAILGIKFPRGQTGDELLDAYRTELIHVAAVAVAAVESLERNRS